MAVIHAPPEFVVPSRNKTTLASAALSICLCGTLGSSILCSDHLWSAGQRAPRPESLSRITRPQHFRLSVDLAERNLAGEIPKSGGPGAGGGSRGTNTVDPRLLSFKRVDVPPVEDLENLLPLPKRNPVPTFAGEATLPKALGGDGNPSGHGMGYGYGSGNGIRQGNGRVKPEAPRQWGVMKKVVADYPPRALKFKIEGYVTVRVTVNAQGIPITVEPIQGNEILMAECLRVLMLWRFEEPAKYGLPAPASFPVVHKFFLKDLDPSDA